MKKIVTIAWLFCAQIMASHAQEVQVSKSFFGSKKMANATKKILISQFRVNYQLIHA
jgi:hypothetical protein